MSNATRSEKSFALLVAISLSLFVFVIAAGEAEAEEQTALPIAQRCATPPGTATCPPTVGLSPTETLPDGTTANRVPPARPFPPPPDSVPPAPGSEPGPGQHALPSPGANVDDPGPKPIRPQGPPPEAFSTHSDQHGPATSPVDQPQFKITPEQEDLPTPGSAPDPGPPAIEDSVVPGSTTDPKPAPYAPWKDGSDGSPPSSSAPDKLPTSGSAPTSPSLPVEPAGKSAPSAVDSPADRGADQMPAWVQRSGVAPSALRQVVEPFVQQTLPGSAAASRGGMQDALTQTLKAVSETVASNLVGTLERWTAHLLPSGEAAQVPFGAAALDPLDPLFPPMLPSEDSSFFSLTGVGQVGTGGGLGLILLGVLATVLILQRRDGPLYWISGESPKPTSALLLPLERPG